MGHESYLFCDACKARIEWQGRWRIYVSRYGRDSVELDFCEACLPEVKDDGVSGLRDLIKKVLKL